MLGDILGVATAMFYGAYQLTVTRAHSRASTSVIMAWSGLSFRSSEAELGKLIYALINVGLIFLGAAIGRRIFTVLGALGVAGYLGYLSHVLFKDSLMFPFALTGLGLALVALGIWWQRHEAAITARLARWVPQGLQPR